MQSCIIYVWYTTTYIIIFVIEITFLGTPGFWDVQSDYDLGSQAQEDISWEFEFKNERPNTDDPPDVTPIRTNIFPPPEVSKLEASLKKTLALFHKEQDKSRELMKTVQKLELAQEKRKSRARTQRRRKQKPEPQDRS